MLHGNCSADSTKALSICSAAVLILCLHALLSRDYAPFTMTSINYDTMEGSVSTGEPITARNENLGQRRTLFLIDDPKTVEQKALSVRISDPYTLCRSPCNGVNPWICDLPLSCIHPDPPDAPRLNELRGIALLLHWKDCSTVQQCSLAYLMIPKAGSTLVKNTMAATGAVEPIWLSPIDGTDLTNNNPLIFTLLRDPGERIVSAYSTIMSRSEGVYGWINGIPVSFPDAPDDGTDVAEWIIHFNRSIHIMMVTVKENGWYNANTNPVWNEHILPQVEFMRGLHVSFIGCVGSINEDLRKFQLDPSSQRVENNAYEHNDNMPAQKFASYDSLDDETKALLRDVYSNDYELFLSTCS